MDSTKKRKIFTCAELIIFILFFIILIRVIIININNKNNEIKYVDPQIANTIIRGNIYDRNSKLLAIEVPYYSCSFRVDKITNLEKIATMCSPFLEMEPNEIIEIANSYKLQALIKKKINDDLLEPFIAFVNDNSLQNLVKIEKKYGREYPYTFHASQTIGFVGYYNNGLEGIENTLNDELYPGPDLNEDITFGNDVYLTLDMDIQYLCDLQVQRVYEEYKPESVFALVMDAKTGEILAISNKPWFDLNNDDKKDPIPRKNNSISLLYEPGSVFKIFSFAALVDLNQANFEEPFFCDGSSTFEVDGHEFTINCSHEHGIVEKDTMIKYSCNGAISKWALETDTEEFNNKLLEFGFDNKIDLPLNGISKSNIADTEYWSIRSKPTIAFGQELSTTALALTSAATAIANDGFLVQPKIIKQIGEEETANSIQKQIIKKETANYVLESMVKATEEGGTAINCAIDGYRIAAKTGTAQLYNEDTQSYEGGGNLSSTIAIVDADNPKYIIYFAAKQPSKNSIWGSNVAAPAIKEIIKGIIAQNKFN